MQTRITITSIGPAQTVTGKTHYILDDADAGTEVADLARILEAKGYKLQGASGIVPTPAPTPKRAPRKPAARKATPKKD